MQMTEIIGQDYLEEIHFSVDSECVECGDESSWDTVRDEIYGVDKEIEMDCSECDSNHLIVRRITIQK